MHKSLRTGLGRRAILGDLLLISGLVVLSGCLKTTKIGLSFEPRPDMNEGYACRVRIYQLKSETGFMAVPLSDFWKEGPLPFEADVSGPRMEVTLEPGVPKSGMKIKIAKETNFIGAAADFIHPDKNSWKQVLEFSLKKGLIPVTLKKRKEITLIVYRDRIEIAT